MPVPVAARCKAWVCGRSPADIVGSNSTGAIYVCCKCCVLRGRGLCDELIPGLEKFYRLWCVVVCDLDTSSMRRPWPTGGGGAVATNEGKKERKDLIIKVTFTFLVCVYGLVVRVSGYRYRGPGFDPRRYQIF